MLKLIISICQITNANVCKDVEWQIGEEITPYQCVRRAQEKMPEILAKYSGWKVQRYSCKPAGKKSESI